VLCVCHHCLQNREIVIRCGKMYWRRECCVYVVAETLMKLIRSVFCFQVNGVAG
jgi:hypothetical protein